MDIKSSKIYNKPPKTVHENETSNCNITLNSPLSPVTAMSSVELVVLASLIFKPENEAYIIQKCQLVQFQHIFGHACPKKVAWSIFMVFGAFWLKTLSSILFGDLEDPCFDALCDHIWPYAPIGNGRGRKLDFFWWLLGPNTIFV